MKRPGWNTPDSFNGVRVERIGLTVFIPMPRKAWRKIAGGCCCPWCSPDGKPRDAYWDTIALRQEQPTVDGKPTYAGDTTWEVHSPKSHGVTMKRPDEMAKGNASVHGDVAVRPVS